MMSPAIGEASQDPKFINYLFTLKRYDCHFVVGNNQQDEPETIGVVPVMLMAHSDVLQSEMFCREIESEKCVTVNDIYPDTFRNLLRYVYGYDNTDTLSFDEADNLLYAADKYLIDSLTSRLVNRLVKMLNPDNICSLLNNPACYRQLELDSAITQILQLETKRVLDSPLFLDLSSDALVKVFEQERITVKEIDIWRAAVSWAKQQTNSDNGQDLRNALEGPAKHIRLCTIDVESFVDEVCPTGILTAEEVNMVFFSKVKKQKYNNLISFSNEIESRIIVSRKLEFMHHREEWNSSSGTFDIYTKNWAIELLPFKFRKEMAIEIDNITITITEHTSSSSTEPPQSMVIKAFDLSNDEELSVPMAKEGKNIILQPNSKYSVSAKFSDNVIMYFGEDNQDYENEHIKVNFYTDSDGYYETPLQALCYRACPMRKRALATLNPVEHPAKRQCNEQQE